MNIERNIEARALALCVEKQQVFAPVHFPLHGSFSLFGRHVGERILYCDLLGVAAVLDEHVERLDRAGGDSRCGELVATGDRCAGAGEVLHLRLARVQLRPKAGEHGNDRDADCCDRGGAAEHEACPAAPGSVFGMAAIDEPPRHHPDTVHLGSEHCEHRRQQGERGQHRDDRDQHAADAHPAQQRQRQDDHRQKPDRDGRAGDDHRVAGVGHRLDERRLDVVPVAELIAEAEDHQQRVVDRHAEADQRDQELDDDRDVRDVGQRPHQGEGVEDRRHRDGDRHQHGGQRAEDEEQDHERAEASDHGLEQHARAAASMRARLLERVMAGHLHSRSGRQAGRRGRAHALGTALRVELGQPGRVDLLEGRVPVARHVDQAAGGEVGTCPRARQSRRRALHRLLFVASPLVWKTTTSGGRTPLPNAFSVRWFASYADLPGIEKLWYQRFETWPAAKPPKSVRTTQTTMMARR